MVELTRKFAVVGPLAFRTTLGHFRHGRGDRTVLLEAHRMVRAFWTPLGPATLELVQVNGGIEARAWGQGAEHALENAPAIVGADDSTEGFEPTGLIKSLFEQNPGIRITRDDCVFHSLLPAILGQKVTGKEAYWAYASILRDWGHDAPGPFPLRLPPRPEELAKHTYFEFHPMGVERKRADTILFAAKRARRIEEVTQMSLPDAKQRLLAFRGIGEWTYAEVARACLGDADAVSVGDYHVKNIVAFNLAGEPRATDERMLELLLPFSGHRGRVQRLLEVGGKTPPRYGPRMTIRDFRHH